MNATNPDIRAALLHTLGKTYYRFGDLSRAEEKINQLRTNYPQSVHSYHSLPIMELIAIARRDTVQMNAVIDEMRTQGYAQDDMHFAYALKRGYLRLKKHLAMQKSFGEFEATRDQVKNSTALPSIRNYPNPLNPSTIIEYTLPENSHVNLRVLNSLGQEIAALANEEKRAGSHSVAFDSNVLPPGLYFYVLTTETGIVSGKMMVVK